MHDLAKEMQSNMVKNQKDFLDTVSDTTDTSPLYGGETALPALVDTDPWDGLKTVKLNPEHLIQNHIISDSATSPAHAPFDVLRTRLLQIGRASCRERV